MEFIALDSCCLSLKSPLFNKATVPDVLYHYTSIYALQNIITTNSLWLTNSKFLNDSKEITYGHDLILKIAKELMVEQKISNNFYELLIETLNNFLNNKLNEIYILSLSKTQDSFLLWSNYSKSEGYNFSFSIREFLENIHKYGRVLGSEKEYKLSLNSDIYMSIVTMEGDLISVDKYIDPENPFFISYNDVIYDIKEQTEYVTYILTTVNTYFVEHYDEKYLRKLKRFTSSLLTKLINALIFFKHPSFKQEEEYRIMVTTNICSKKFEKHRISNGSFIPYLELNFKDKLIPLDGLSIGPKNNSDIALQGLKSFLTKNNFNVEKINFTKSEIPLRY